MGQWDTGTVGDVMGSRLATIVVESRLLVREALKSLMAENSYRVICDIGSTAEFSAAFSRVGLFPDGGILWTLPQRVSYAAARRLLMTGERINAAEALRLLRGPCRDRRRSR